MLGLDSSIHIRHLYLVDVEGDEENLTDEMSVWPSVSAGVKGMHVRRQQRERRAVAVSRFETYME